MHYVKCVLLSFYEFTLNYFFYFGKNSARRYHRCIVVFKPKPFLTKLKFSWKILIKVPNTKFRRSLFGGCRVFHSG